MPQVNAHMGGNQVIGFKSSVIAEKVGLFMSLYFCIDEMYCQSVFTV